MTEWSVWIEASTDVAPPTDEQLEALADALAEHGGIVAGGNGHPASGQFTVGPADLGKAQMIAREVWRSAARSAGLFDDIGAMHLTEWERFLAQLDEPNFPDLIGTTELAELLDVSRQRAHTIAQRDDFPQPVARLANGPVWTRPSIQHFLDTWERKPGRPTSSVHDTGIAALKVAVRASREAGAEVITMRPNRKTATNVRSTEMKRMAASGRFVAKEGTVKRPKSTVTETARKKPKQ